MRARLDVPSDRDASGRSLGEEELELLGEVIRSGSLNSTSGTMVRRFEEAFAAELGVAHCIACSSGSTAVQSAVSALEPRPGDPIVSSPITDYGALTALIYEGVVPAFCDVDPDTLMPTAETIARALDGCRAVMATHLFGQAARVEEIAELCRERQLPLIEDAAQALGSGHLGRPAGTFGLCGTFSFQQSKHITCGEGGAVVTNDGDLARRVRLFVNKAWPYGEPGPDHLFLAPNGRLTELQAAVLLPQLAKLPELVARRRESAVTLLGEIKDVGGVEFRGEVEGHSFWRVPLMVDPAVIAGGASSLGEALRAEGIPCQPHYVGRPAFALKAFRERSFFGGSGFPLVGPHRETAWVLEQVSDYPGVVRGLERVLVLSWNERIPVELAREIGRRVALVAEELVA